MIIKQEVLMVDGYNMIGSWPNLAPLKKMDEMADARDRLLHDLSEYSRYKKIKTIVVFDAQLVPGIQRRYDYHSLEVVFTQEDETADSYIERTLSDYQNALTNVTVATSDYAEQRIVLGKGSSRKSAPELYKDVQEAKRDVHSDYRAYSVRRHNPRLSQWSDDDLDKLQDLYWDIVDKNKKK